ncbi:MAG: oxygenase MpaB family protein [Acidimicrobiia bacterium]
MEPYEPDPLPPADITVDWRALVGDEPALNAFLDELRTRGDAAADTAIASANAMLAAAGVRFEGFEMVYRNMRSVPFGDAACAAVEEFLASLPTPCDWMTPHDTERAQRFFTINAVPLGLGLYCASLPEAYSDATAAAILVRPSKERRTGGELVSRPARRAAETATVLRDLFITPPKSSDVARPAGMSGLDEQALATLRGVRLLHAAVRAATGPMPGRGGIEVAANQEDLLGTVLTFSASALGACRRLGVRPSEADALAYMKMWCFIGVQLGLDEHLVAGLDDLKTATALKDAILCRRRAETADGKLLMSALLNGFPKVMHPIAPTLVRKLAGRQTAAAVGVRPTPVRAVIAVPAIAAMQATGTVWRIAGRLGAGDLQAALGRRMVDGWIRTFDGEAPAVRPSFRRLHQARTWLAVRATATRKSVRKQSS